MKNHRNSLRLGLLAAGIAASAIATAGNGVPALQAAGAKSRLATIEAESDRLPVVSLTSTMGDVGFEIFDGKTKRVNLASLPKDATDAIVYVDVDSVDLNRKKTQATLNLARDLGWVVLAESSSWDVQRLHAFIATYFPGTSTKGPAKGSLYRYAISVNADGDIIVNKEKQFAEKEWEQEGAFITV